MNTKQTIENAYEALERVCESTDSDHPRRLFDRLTNVATAHERQHRRGTGAGARMRKSSVATAAKYFVVRCVYAPLPGVDPNGIFGGPPPLSTLQTVAGLATLREDYQIGAMLGAYLRVYAALPALPDGFDAIDYATDLA